jgi:hypothetical protein
MQEMQETPKNSLEDKNIILVNGLPRAGKDTFADYMVQKYNFVKFSFADELKDIVCRTFDISREDLDYFKNDQIELCYNNGGRYEELINFRDLLRRFGTEGMKPAFGDSVWADVLYRKIEQSKHKNIIVPDFRFLCEYKNLDNIKTVLVQDERELPIEGHASDVELYQNNFKFNYVLYNNKDESFFKEIDNLTKELIKN